MAKKKPKIEVEVVNTKASGVEVDVKTDYGWSGRVWIPEVEEERIKKRLKQIYKANKPAPKDIKVPKEFDW